MVGSKLRVLILEDNITTATTLEKILEFEGFEVITSYRGDECILKAKDDQPHIIILDVILSATDTFRDGFKVHDKLKSDPKTSHIKVVFLTGEAISDDDAARGVEVADDYVRKGDQYTKEIVARIKKIAKTIVNYPVLKNPIRILHLSDLHFAADSSPDTKLRWLADDLTKGEDLGVDHLNYLVVSGDLTDKGSNEGFEKAASFISSLIDEFRISPDCCILVPGNHDIQDIDEAYHRVRQQPSSNEADEFVQQGNIWLGRDEQQYPLRFRRFSEVFQKLLKQPYPLPFKEQGIAYLFPEDRLQFLTLNSSWRIDEFNRKRSDIHPDAVAFAVTSGNRQVIQAIEQAKLQPNERVLRIGVWHHAIAGPEQIKDTYFLEHLQNHDVSLALHGDIHELRRDLVSYWDNRRRLRIIGAGSFGANAQARPEATPRLYNLLEIQRDFMSFRVHTRYQPEANSTWSGWTMWPRADGQPGRLPYYDEVLS